MRAGCNFRSIRSSWSCAASNLYMRAGCNYDHPSFQHRWIPPTCTCARVATFPGRTNHLRGRPSNLYMRAGCNKSLRHLTRHIPVPPTCTCARVATHNISKVRCRQVPPTCTCARVATHNTTPFSLAPKGAGVLQPVHARGLQLTNSAHEDTHSHLQPVHARGLQLQKTGRSIKTISTSNLYMRAGCNVV